MLEVHPTACFWNNEFFYKSRNWISRTESDSCLRDVISFLFGRDHNCTCCNQFYFFLQSIL